MRVLGVSAYYHDAAAALVIDGELVAASQEERFTRRRHDAEFPRLAIASCLEQANMGMDALDAVVFYDKPILKFERILDTHAATWPMSLPSFIKALPVWLKQKLWTSRSIAKELKAYLGPILFSTHHLSHAASAFYSSGFDQAAVLTVDGVGEWATCSLGVGDGKKLELLKEIRFPHSLGLLYSAITGYLGFKVNSGEYKVMGLAPYGEPRFVDKMKQLIVVHDDGSFSLDMRYFAYVGGLRMFNGRLERLFGVPARSPKDPLEQVHKDLARSLQVATEDAMLALAHAAFRETGARSLCLAGGVALNCVANGRLMREGPFEQLFIQPAAGDAGGAVGAAQYVAHALYDEPRRPMKHAYLGPSFGPRAGRELVAKLGVPHHAFDSEDALMEELVTRLERQEVIGFFHGAMEFGPRALGHRSILADPRGERMRDIVNEKVKMREGFRPFAPAVPLSRAAEWFELDVESPYMLLTAPVRRSGVPAITHVDGSARIQTVTAQSSPRFHRLLEAWGARTGCPVLINTSFNVRGEPIVCSPDDAYRCFRGSGLDALVVEDVVLDKREMPRDPAFDAYHLGFAAD
jgi:carbamoyltransferase